MDLAKRTITSLLESAGITIGGLNEYDIQVWDDRFYRRVLLQGSLGLGESYMDEWWGCDDLEGFFFKILSAGLDRKHIGFAGLANIIRARLFNLQAVHRAFTVGEKHYDTGNDLFESMLDSRLTYSCGYWRTAENLEDAQEVKLDRVCQKLGLYEGNRVLDIGCGWGSFARFAAEQYGAIVDGITVSVEQVEYTRKICIDLPVDIYYMDYRDLAENSGHWTGRSLGSYDRIVSIGMFEHVGVKNYRTFFETAARCLKDDGLFLLHCIGSSRSTKTTDPWIEKYIFPNGMLPSLAQISKAVEGLFVVEDVENFGAYYAPTLRAWFENFDRSWEKLKSNYSEKFYRMWKYYLLSCAGASQARHFQLYQIVLSKKGVPGGYVRPY